MEVDRESAWKRSWRDTKHRWGDWRFLLLEAVVSPTAGFITTEVTNNATFGFGAGIGTVLFGLISVWTWITLRTPYRQRDEAWSHISSFSSRGLEVIRIDPLPNPSWSKSTVDDEKTSSMVVRAAIKNNGSTAFRGVTAEIRAYDPETGELVRAAHNGRWAEDLYGQPPRRSTDFELGSVNLLCLVMKYYDDEEAFIFTNDNLTSPGGRHQPHELPDHDYDLLVVLAGHTHDVPPRPMRKVFSFYLANHGSNDVVEVDIDTAGTLLSEDREVLP